MGSAQSMKQGMWLCDWGAEGVERGEVNEEASTLWAEPDAGGESPLDTGRRLAIG